MSKAHEKELIKITVPQFVAIDPLALLFRSDIYVRIIEGKHPHVPRVEEIREAAREITREEREATLARARAMAAYAKVVEEALA